MNKQAYWSVFHQELKYFHDYLYQVSHSESSVCDPDAVGWDRPSTVQQQNQSSEDVKITSSLVKQKKKKKLSKSIC